MHNNAVDVPALRTHSGILRVGGDKVDDQEPDQAVQELVIPRAGVLRLHRHGRADQSAVGRRHAVL
eukprot:10407-Eustigmatos_ZCMA.PRE.1